MYWAIIKSLCNLKFDIHIINQKLRQKSQLVFLVL